jgi:predicted dehydrogenase
MRAAVIGAGRMGRRHVKVLRDLGLELVGLGDSSRPALEVAAREDGVPADALYIDPARMLEERRPECVVVATTTPSHADYTCRAAEAGARVVLCEKPMAASLAECDRMLEACGKSGTRLAVNHQMRFMEQYTAPRALLESEDFGGLRSVLVAGGNFGLAMNGTHYFEMFRFMAGEPPATVAAWFSAGAVANPRGPEFEDRAGCVRMETRSGKRFYMDVSDDQGHGVKVTYSARHGQITVDELAGVMVLDVRQDEHRALPTTRYGMPNRREERRIAPADAVAPTRAVLEALLRGTGYPTGEDGRLAVAALVAAYVSDESGHRMVAIDSGALPVERRFPWA